MVQQATSRQTKKLVREHEVELDETTGLVSILGGKWTTYRVMAEHTVNVVARLLGDADRHSSSQHHPLAGASGYAPDYWKTVAQEYVLAESTARHLTEKFGTQSPAVLELTKTNPELKLPIVGGASAIHAEIVYCVRQEMAVTIEDVLARRIGLQYFDWKLAMQAAPVVASHLAQELAWSDQQKNDAVQIYVSKINRCLTSIGLPSRW